MAGFSHMILPSMALGIFHIIYTHAQSFELTLDKELKYRLIWNIDSENRIIHFEVLVETLGFVAFGVTNDGKMKGADLIIAAEDRNGFILVEDYHGIGENEKPVLDDQQDWIVTMASRNGSHTNLNFYRAFDTGDDKDDVAFSDTNTYFIWSYSPNDSQVFRYHGDAKSGTFRINLFSAILGGSWLDHSNHPMDHSSPVPSPKSTPRSVNPRKNTNKHGRRKHKPTKGSSKNSGLGNTSGISANEEIIDSTTRAALVDAVKDAPELHVSQTDHDLAKLETTNVSVDQTSTSKADEPVAIDVSGNPTPEPIKHRKGTKKPITSKKPKDFVKHASIVKVTDLKPKPSETIPTPVPGSAGISTTSGQILFVFIANIFTLFALK